MTFIEVLNNEEAHNLVDQIEELLGEDEKVLVRIRTDLINELKEKFGYEYEIQEALMNKPECKLIGKDGNIFNLIGIASKTLKQNDMKNEAAEMCQRVYQSGSYQEALVIIGEYVDII